MKSYDSGGSDDLVTPDDALSEEQLERFPGEPEKSRIGEPGHEAWIYDDGTRIYGAEAYGFLSDLVDNDVLEGERGLTDVDMEKLRYVATQVKGVESPVTWVDEGSYSKGDIEEELPVDGRLYFQETVPMSVEMRGSDDLANRLSFLRSAQEVDDTDVLRDDLDEKDIDADSRGMIDRINNQLNSGNFVVPIVYSQQGQPVSRRRVAFVYRPEDQSGLNDDFENFVRGLSDRKEDALKAELETGANHDVEEDTVSFDSSAPTRPPELRRFDDEGRYELSFDARRYSDAKELDVDLSDGDIVVVDGNGEEVTRRDVEYDHFLDEEDLRDLNLEDLDISNGVGQVILSED
jgi:hypothetical protein